MNNFAKIIHVQRGDMKLAYVENNEINYLELFDRCLANKVKKETLGNPNPEKFTYLINEKNAKYIFKIDDFVE